MGTSFRRIEKHGRAWLYVLPFVLVAQGIGDSARALDRGDEERCAALAAVAALAARDFDALTDQEKSKLKAFTPQQKSELSYCENARLAVDMGTADRALSLSERKALLDAIGSNDIQPFLKLELDLAIEASKSVGRCKTTAVSSCFEGKSPDQFFAAKDGSGSCVNSKLDAEVDSTVASEAKAAQEYRQSGKAKEDSDFTLENPAYKDAHAKAVAAARAFAAMGEIYKKVSNVRAYIQLCNRGALKGYADSSPKQAVAYKGPCPSFEILGPAYLAIRKNIESPSSLGACADSGKNASAVARVPVKAKPFVPKLAEKRDEPSYAEVGLDSISRQSSNAVSGDEAASSSKAATIGTLKTTLAPKNGGGETAGFVFKKGAQEKSAGRFDKVSDAVKEQVDAWAKAFEGEPEQFKKKIFELAGEAGALDGEYSKRLNPTMRERVQTDCGTPIQGDSISRLFCARGKVAGYYVKMKELNEKLQQASSDAERKKLAESDPILTALASGECGNGTYLCRMKALNSYLASAPAAVVSLNKAANQGLLASMLAARCAADSGNDCLTAKDIEQVNATMVPANWVTAHAYQPLSFGSKEDSAHALGSAGKGSSETGAVATAAPGGSAPTPSRGAGKSGSDQVSSYFPNPWSVGKWPFPKSLCNLGLRAASLGSGMGAAQALAQDCDNVKRASETPPEAWRAAHCAQIDAACKDPQAGADPASGEALQDGVVKLQGRALDVKIRVESSKAVLERLALQYFNLQSHTGTMDLGELLAACNVPDGPNNVLEGARYKDLGIADALKNAFTVASTANPSKTSNDQTKATFSAQDRAKYSGYLVEAAQLLNEYDAQIATIGKDFSQSPKEIEESWTDHLPCQALIKAYRGFTSNIVDRSAKCNSDEMVAAWIVDRQMQGKSQDVCEVDASESPADVLMRNYLERITGEDRALLEEEQDEQFAAAEEERKQIATGVAQGVREKGSVSGKKTAPGGAPELKAPEYASLGEKPKIASPSPKNFYAPILRKTCDSSGKNCVLVPCKKDACNVKRSVMEALMAKRVQLMARFPELAVKVNDKLVGDAEGGDFFYRRMKSREETDRAMGRLKGVNQDELSVLRRSIEEICRFPESTGVKLLANKTAEGFVMGCSETAFMPPGASKDAARAAEASASRCRFLKRNTKRLCEMEHWQKKASLVAVGDKGGALGSDGYETLSLQESNEAFMGMYGAIMDAHACVGVLKGAKNLLKAGTRMQLKSMPRFLAGAGVAVGKHLVKGMIGPSGWAMTTAGAEKSFVGAGVGGGLNAVAVEKGLCGVGIWSEEQCTQVHKQADTLKGVLRKEIGTAFKSAVVMAGMGGVGETMQAQAHKRTARLARDLDGAEKTWDQARESSDPRKVDAARKKVDRARAALARQVRENIAVNMNRKPSQVEAMGFTPEELVEMGREASQPGRGKPQKASKKVADKAGKNKGGKGNPYREAPEKPGLSWEDIAAFAGLGEDAVKGKNPREIMKRIRQAIEALQAKTEAGEVTPEQAQTILDSLNNLYAKIKANEAPAVAGRKPIGKTVAIDGKTWQLAQEPSVYRERYSKLLDRHPEQKDSAAAMALLDLLEAEHANERDPKVRKSKVEREAEKIFEQFKPKCST